MVTEEDSLIFKEYKNKAIYKSICSKFSDYFISATSAIEASELFFNTVENCSSYKESLAGIKKILNKDGIDKYRLQFKQFKYRQKNQLVNITIKRETYNKLTVLKEDFDGINDMLFEYALDNHHHIDTAKIQDMPSCLSKDQRLTVTLALLDPAVKKMMEDAMQDAYESGIKAGQAMKKIRSKKALDEALSAVKYQRN